MKKVILLMSLIFLLFSGTITAFTYAEQNKDIYLENETEFIRISNGIRTNNSSRLIPSGAIQGQNDVYEIYFEYEIFFNKDYDLDIAVDELSLSTGLLSEEALHELFNFEISVEYQNNVKVNNGLFDEIEDGSKAIVTITVSLNMPQNKLQYDAITTSTLDFTALFTIIK